jgi:hypothetical protein
MMALNILKLILNGVIIIALYYIQKCNQDTASYPTLFLSLVLFGIYMVVLVKV